MEYTRTVEKRKLVLFRNMIDSLLSLEDFVMERDGELSRELADRLGHLSEETNSMLGQQFQEMDMIPVLEEILLIVKDKHKSIQRAKQMIPPVAIQNQELCGETELFFPEDSNCEKPFIETTFLETPRRLPFLVRKSTKEKILINRDVFKIGKEKSFVDYYVENDAVSRAHADIIRRKDNFYVVDQDSLNHTFLEGRQIPARQYVRLESGQSFVLANEEFTFYYEAIK